MRKFSKLIGALVGAFGGKLLSAPLAGLVVALPGIPASAAQPIEQLIDLALIGVATYGAPANQR